MQEIEELGTWVSDKLMSLIEYSQPIVVKYVLGISKQALSPADIVRQLEAVGLPSSTETSAFAEEIFKRVPHKKSPGSSLYQVREREAVMFAMRQRDYELIEADEEDEDGVVTDSEAEKRVKDDDGSESETKRVSKKTKEEANGLENNDVGYLRRKSRQKYLKEREKRKLKEMRDDIEDEHSLFDGIPLTEKEDRELRHKIQVYELAKKRSRAAADDDDDMGEYRIPEAYDREGGVNQERRFAVAKQKYWDSSGEKNPFAEQRAWEEHQIRKATLKFGSKNRSPVSDHYDLVFDSLEDNMIVDEPCIKPVDRKRVVNLNNTNIEDKPRVKPVDRRMVINSDEKKALPVYAYRDKLLEAIHEHQILVIVGETGSGKTTQIPQFLHEAGYTKRGKIGCTQPRRVAAMSVAARVAREMGVKLGHEVGYSVRFEDCTSEKTVLKYMTDGMLLRELLGEPDLASYSVLMVDEAHERTVSTDVLFGLVKDIARLRPDLKLLISSATLDAEKFSNYFDYARIFEIPGRKYPVEVVYAKHPVSDYVGAAIDTAIEIHRNQPSGDILVFLTGQEEIEMAEEMLRQRMKELGTKVEELIICPIFGNLPTELQTKIFEPTPERARKVVLATNIAETSLTIDGIKYVIDSGFCKLKSCSPRTGMESLLVTPISKASAMQRTGRAGRTGPGKCYRLYTAYSFKSEMDDNTRPEIQRIDLTNVVLTLKSLGVEDLLHFDFMDHPPSEALLKALELLFALNALNKSGELTKTGRKMAELPLDPMLSKMIVESDKYKCSDEIITIAAMLSVGYSIFYYPKNKKLLAENARKNFSRGGVGDHITLLNVYASWKETNFSTQWCYENFVQVRSMKRARDIRDQLEGLLKRVEIELISNPNDLEAIKKAVTSGFFTRSARLQKNGFYQTVKHPQTVYIHPSSGLSGEFPRWVIYHELVLTTKEYMRQVTELKPEWLLEIAPHYYELKDVEDKEIGKRRA